MTRSLNNSDIEFVYDAAGNRVRKKIRTKNSGGTYTPASDNTNYYIRDASGNIMAVYEEASGVQTLAELPIYGSDRVGALTPKLNTIGSNRFIRSAGRKSFELKDHLGNVSVVINDFKIGRDNTGDSKSDYYLAKISSFSDYGPFGELLEARTSNASRYRYGFNGQEKDDEVKGSGNSYDFGARIYDPRVGRFLSLDPLSTQYSSESNYSYAGNSPIVMIDRDGEKKTWYIVTVREDGSYTVFKVTNHEKVKVKTYKNTFTYTEHEGVGFKYSWESTKEFNLKQTVLIDKRKPEGEQVTLFDEEEDGETKSWVGELFEDSPNLIIYGNGKFKGQIELGSLMRGKGKTSVITSDEAAEILSLIKTSGGFKNKKTKPIEAITKVFDKLSKIGKEVESWNKGNYVENDTVINDDKNLIIYRYEHNSKGEFIRELDPIREEKE